MKTFYAVSIVLACMLLPSFLWGQTDDIKNLKAKLRSRSGIERIETYLALSDAYVKAGKYGDAREHAINAIDLAKRMKRTDYQAIGLNREGKALAISGKRGLFGKDLALCPVPGKQ